MKCNGKVHIIQKGDQFKIKDHHTLEGWKKLYQHGILMFIIPENELRKEFKTIAQIGDNNAIY